PEHGQTVPNTFRTDGRWIWSDAAAYYLHRYGLAPDPGLLAYIREREYVMPTVDGAAQHRAGAALRRLLRGPGRPITPRARAVTGCHLYMRLPPCSCGESYSPWTRHESGPANGCDLSVYEGQCPSCGAGRRYAFLVERPATAPPGFGGAAPSTII